MSDKKKQRCWWRYNNAGGRYMTCNYSQVGSKESRKTAPKPIPRLTPEEFIEKVGKEGYSDLTKAQKNEYHRLDMAERRAEVRKEMETIRKQLEFKKEQEKPSKKKSPKRPVGRPEKKASEYILKGDKKKEFLEDIEYAYKSGQKIYSKERILKSLGEEEGNKLIKKYKDAFFKSRN